MSQKTYRCDMDATNADPDWPNYFGCTEAELEEYVQHIPDLIAIRELEVGQKHCDVTFDTWVRLT